MLIIMAYTQIVLLKSVSQVSQSPNILLTLFFHEILSVHDVYSSIVATAALRKATLQEVRLPICTHTTFTEEFSDYIDMHSIIICNIPTKPSKN